VLVDELFDFQSKMMDQAAEDGKSSLLAYCLELTSIAVACEESEIARDFYISSYTSPVTLEIIRKNDSERAREIFGDYCQNWSDNQFLEAETLISGIEYATFMTTESSSPLDVRISGALNTIMMIYNVPEEIRKDKIRKALSLDYRSMGKLILSEFVKYVNDTNESTFEELISSKKKS
jgi:hypothetical protein